MARAAVQGNNLNTFGRLFAVAQAVGPAWTSNNLEGFFSLEDVAPTLLEGSIWRLRLVPFSYNLCLVPNTSVPVRDCWGLRDRLSRREG